MSLPCLKSTAQAVFDNSIAVAAQGHFWPRIFLARFFQNGIRRRSCDVLTCPNYVESSARIGEAKVITHFSFQYPKSRGNQDNSDTPKTADRYGRRAARPVVASARDTVGKAVPNLILRIS